MIGDLLLIGAMALLLGAAGYPLTARLSSSRPAERFAGATLAGLAVWLWTLSVIALFRPLSGAWAWVTCWPVVWLALDPFARRHFGRDLLTLGRNRKALGALAASVVLVAILLWPEWTQPGLVFHDGTSNHDAFFWITGAKYLQAHTYLEAPALDLSHPWANIVRAICGWNPAWGRAGAESHLAALASLTHCDPMRIYLSAVAGLLTAWVAAVLLVYRTFYTTNLTWLAALALGGLQPLFAFFVINGNLPNLLGCIMGSTVVFAVERALREAPARTAWLGLAVLATHATAFAYPEIVPFVLLPTAALIGRAALRHQLPRASNLALIAAALACAVLNPATTVRAWVGFAHSFSSTHHDAQWADIFGQIEPVQYGPALATLSIEGALYFGPVLGAIGTLFLLWAAFRAVRRATDPVGAVATFLGGGALVAYTVLTGFTYGWQKTAQFTAVFLSAVLPVAALACFSSGGSSGLKHRARWALSAVIVGVFGAAIFFHGSGSLKWSHRKLIREDWFALRAASEATLRDASIRIEPDTFSYSFFYGTWAAYFLPDCRLVYTGADHQDAGYLRDRVGWDDPNSPTEVSAVLTGRAWADMFDANCERLREGREFALLRHANRVKLISGLSSANAGPPETAANTVVLEVEPHSASEFHLTLGGADKSEAVWAIAVHEADGEPLVTTVQGPPPWKFRASLAGGRISRIEIHRRDAAGEALYPILDLKVASPL